MTNSQLAILCAVALATSLIVPGAHAQSVDISKGKQRAEVCTACHGQDGLTPAAPAIPHLAGQDRDYLIKALTAYRGGETRTDPTMTAMAKPLSDDDIVNIAAFFSSLPPSR